MPDAGHLSDLVLDELIAGFPVRDDHRAHLASCAPCAEKRDRFLRDRAALIERADYAAAVARLRASPAAAVDLMLPSHPGSRLSPAVVARMLARTPPLGPAPELRGHLAPPSGDPNSLPQQRWALVTPAGPHGDRLLELVEPLRRKRQEDQGGAPVEVHRFAPGADAPAAPAARYVLILGDPGEVPLELQRAFSSEAYVGRLAFFQDDDYDRYVQKVLRWERAPTTARAGRAIVSTPPGLALPEQGYLDSMLELCRREASLGRFAAREIIALSNGVEELRALASGGPDVLFTLSRDAWLEELVAGPFLPGGSWIDLASFSAAEGVDSLYGPWLRQLQAEGVAREEMRDLVDERGRAGAPRIAGPARAALANPDGPLAVIGHSDLAWSLDCKDASGFDHVACLATVVNDCVQGGRVGVGHHGLTRSAEEIDTQLRILAQGEGGEGVKRGCLWLASQDLRSLILLGDPAARLPVAHPAGATAR